MTSATKPIGVGTWQSSLCGSSSHRTLEPLVDVSCAYRCLATDQGLHRLGLGVGHVQRSDDGNIAADLERADIQPWAGAPFMEHRGELAKDDPGTIGRQPLGRRDFGGHPHTESLRITERFRRADFGHL